jgi:hypothetical protein
VAVSTPRQAGASLVLISLVVLLFSASVAVAAKVHLPVETFGSTAHPSFARPFGVAVDQSVTPNPSAGDVLVFEAGAGEVQSLKIKAEAGQFRLTYGGLSTSATATGETTSASKLVKNLTSISGTLTRGEAVSGTGIPAGATVSKLISSTEIELSTAATATATGVGLTAGGLPFNVSATNLAAALEDLTSFTSGIKVSGGPGSKTGSAPYTIEFFSRNAEQLVVSNGETPLSGGEGGTEATVTTTTEGVNAAVERFQPDGEAAPFSGLGSNAIDGQRGPGGHTRAECETAPEPASCDETPQNGFAIPASGAGSAPSEVEIAVDNSGGLTDGNIYISQAKRKLVSIFDKEGKYLGQLTAAGTTAFAGEILGVAVAPSGHIYATQIGSSKVTYEFAPSGAVPTNADYVRSIPVASTPSQPGNVAAGAAATAGSVFLTKFAANPALKFNSAGTSPYGFGNGRLVAVDPSTGSVIVSGANNIATEFDASGETEAIQESTLTAPAGSTIQGLAVSGTSGEIYITRSGSSNVEVYGPTVSTPTVKVLASTEISPTSAQLNGSVATEGTALESCVFEYGPTLGYGTTVPCSGSVPADGEPHPVNVAVSGLQPEATYHFRVVATNAAGPSESNDETFTTSARVLTEPAGAIGAGVATLNGRVDPAGQALISCVFEYGATNAYGSSAPCVPSAGSISPDFQYHAVRAELSGLARNAAYHYRLAVSTGSGTFRGADMTFTTLGAPQVIEQFATAGATSATIGARINPSGLSTTYYFEWGTTAAYGNRTPAEFDPSAGSGDSPVDVSVQLSGLQLATQYHFRIVAGNSAGMTPGPDQVVGTLDAGGVPDDRVAELVSPRSSEKGPLSIVGEKINQFNGQMRYQVAPDGERAVVELSPGSGQPSSGGEVLYGAARSGGGWRSAQLSPPVIEAVRVGTIGLNTPSFVSYVSEDQSCAVVASHILLTPDAPARTVEEEGSNLFRRNPDGSLTLLTQLSPTNPVSERTSNQLGFLTVGASPDCHRIYFQTTFNYEGIGSGGNPELYEWDEASSPHLHHVGFVPGPSGEVAVPAEGGGNHNMFVGAVSSDGGQIVFQATRQRPGRVAGEGENGKVGVFVRIDGSETIDVSESETTAPDLGARYEYATPAGSRVFFTANAGLTSSGSSAGTDLYEYDLEKQSSEHPLTDLSADTNPVDSAGAGASGVFGASDDGSYVYFAATGQLVAGKGETQAHNIADSTYNVYLARGGVVSYVASVGKPEYQNLVTRESNASTTGSIRQLLSRVTPDGRHLLLESSLPFAGYESHAAREAYLYSAEADSVACISCRRDGQQPLGGATNRPLGTGVSPGNPLHLPVTLSGDGTTAFFESPDPLAPGAVAGNQNIYEWHRGAVYLLATATALPEEQTSGHLVLAAHVEFVGASEDGTNAFIVTPQSLASQDTDGRKDLYDLRVGGGFPAEPQPPAPCNSLLEGACQPGPAAVPPALAPSTPSFTGPGNQKPTKHHKKHHHKRKHHKKKGSSKHKKSTKGANHGRAANRGAGK